MRNQFKRAFDKVSLSSEEKNRIIENVVSNRSVMKERKSFWQGRAGGIATVCAALVVFVLVNAAIFGGMKRGTGTSASDIPENETMESINPEEITDADAEQPTGEEVADAEQPTEESEELEPKVDEALQEELENILAQIESVSVLEIPEEAQTRLFELLADYLPLKNTDANVSMTSGMTIRWQSKHNGIDMTSDDDVPVVYMVMDGTILESGWDSGKGLRLVIDNGNGIVTEYHHLKEIFVSAGDVLSAGAPVAVMGSTGDSTGPHLHWEMTVDGELVNPLCYVAEHLELFYRH